MDSKKVTTGRVKFCKDCDYSYPCKVCEKTFNGRLPLQSTSCQQIKKDFTTFYTENETDMIADLGCPTSVISKMDMNRFIRNLSKYQEINLEIVPVDENFKFGPSGPYKCHQKLRFPIKNGSRNLMAEVAIVDAKIPMLLGNNIFKPLGAKFELFPTGNGMLELADTKIEMKEAAGGHYTIKVSDLGKINGK